MTLGLVLDILIVILLFIIAIVDTREYIIPDKLTVSIACLALLNSYLAGYDVLIGALIGSVIAFVLFDGTRRLMSRRLKRDAMGFGDVKLMAAGALWVGAQSLAFAILVACATALTAFLVVAYRSKSWARDRELPFGPFLSLGLIIARAAELLSNSV